MTYTNPTAVAQFSLLAIVLSVLIGNAHGAPKAYSTNLESELRASLFSGYEVLQRPAKTVVVKISLNLFTINDLDIRAQTLSITGYFSMIWLDSRLEWLSNNTYSNIQFIFSNEDYMWRPAIVVENSIVLSTWAYTASEVALELEPDPFIMEQYTENGEWEIVETTTSASSKVRKGDTNSYSRLYYNIKLRRRPLFHILNTIFPVILMASLIVFVFKLPPESGERVGMSLTVLLAYAVYLTLISESIPRTSLSASILSTYLSIILMLSALSVIFTIIVLDVYFNHEDDESPPLWLQKMTRVCLVRLAMWKGHTCCSSRKRTVTPTGNVDVDSFDDVDIKLEKHELKQDIMINANQRFGKPSEKEPQEAWANAPEEKMFSWKEVALILDRFFMYLFIFMVVSATIGCFAILGTKY